MIVKNGSILFSKGKIGNATIEDADMKTTSGSSMGIVVDRRKSSIGASDYFIDVGKGTTEPAINDYSLSDTISSSSISRGTSSSSYTSTGNLIITRPFTNNSAEDITITELGMFVTVSSYTYMLARILLDVPRTITPNETATFSYVVSFN